MNRREQLELFARCERLSAPIYRVTIKMRREYAATIAIRAESQEAADQAALELFYEWEDKQVLDLGFPPPWQEHESIDSEAEVDTLFRCVDCGKDTGNSGEYYSVTDEVWAASGIAPNGGMLCLADLERRIGRPLTEADFLSLMMPAPEAWKRHVDSRSATD